MDRHSRSALLCVSFILLATGLDLSKPSPTMPRSSGVPGDSYPRRPSPVSDPEPAGDPGSDAVSIGQYFDRFKGSPGDPAASWPHFLGPRYDGVNHETVALASHWAGDGPRLVWKAKLLGDGQSSPIVHRGRVFLMDYDPGARTEMLRCFSFQTGQELWRRWHRIKLFNSHGFIHASVAVNDDFLVGIGARGHLMCLNPETGDLRWATNLDKEFGFRATYSWNAQCPLLVDSTVIVAVGSPQCLLAGFDAATGRLLWKSGNPGAGTASFSSAVPATIGGQRVYLYSAQEKTVAVDARTGREGQVLWHYPRTNFVSPILVPVVIDEDLVFLTDAYQWGSALVNVSQGCKGAEAHALWTHEARDGFCTFAHVPLQREGHLFAVLPEEAGANRKQFACMDLEKKGSIKWSSGKDHRFGIWEPFTLADGKFYIMREDGSLTMLRASTEQYEELGRAVVLPGSAGWHPAMALTRGFLLVRDSTTLVCIDLRE